MAKYITSETKARRMKRRRNKKIALLSFCMIFILGTSWGIVKIIELFSAEETAPPIIDNSVLTPNTDLEQNLDIDKVVGPIEQTVNVEIIAPEQKMIQVAENGRVELSYFDDAVFVGDSLADGFRVYKDTTGMVNSTFITAKSISPSSFTIGGYINITNPDGSVESKHGFTAIQEANPKKVYVTLGTNALLAQNDEDFMAGYYTFIEQLQTYVPEALIYVTSVPPAAAFKVQADPRLDITRVYNINTQLAKMCSEKGLAYINLYEVLKSDSGYLREEISYTDGIHLTPQGYKEWADYLISHTVYSPYSPYVPGSPYIV